MIPRASVICILLLIVATTGCLISITSAEEGQFMKEGELSFLSKASGKKIAHIDIEISDTPVKQSRGLMLRSFLPQNAGMLFIFDTSQPLAFWMKNTFISLDIVFVDEHRRIVTIQKNTTPLSEALIFSKKNAKYVVEVNAGLCEKYGIKEGDRIDFRRARKGN